MIALGADVSRTSQSEGMHGAQLAARSYAEKYGAVYMNQFESNIIRIHIFIHWDPN